MKDDVQARILLAGILYRATMRAFAAALAERGLPPPRPEEKMRLHQEVEERAWALPPDVAASAEGRDVDDGIGGLTALEREVDALVGAAVARRGAS